MINQSIREGIFTHALKIANTYSAHLLNDTLQLYIHIHIHFIFLLQGIGIIMYTNLISFLNTLTFYKIFKF